MSRVLDRLREERGFSLIELLVACVAGTVILLAIMTLVDVSQRASSRVEARVQSTQRGRVAMEQITQRLRSQVCLGSATPLVEGKSNELTFFADLGDEIFTPEKRRIFVSGTDLKEEVFNGTGTPPTVTFPGFPGSPSQRRTLLTDIEPVNDSAGNPLPYFRYYAYDDSTPTEPKELLTPPLSDDSRARTVKVEVAFRAGLKVEDERVDSNFVNGVIVRFANPTDLDREKRGPQCT